LFPQTVTRNVDERPKNVEKQTAAPTTPIIEISTTFKNRIHFDEDGVDPERGVGAVDPVQRVQQLFLVCVQQSREDQDPED